MKHISALTVLVLMAGCSPVMEATRPTPVDTSQFAVGESRLQVVEAIGAPTASLKDRGQSCDVYKLYTRGPAVSAKGQLRPAKPWATC